MSPITVSIPQIRCETPVQRIKVGLTCANFRRFEPKITAAFPERSHNERQIDHPCPYRGLCLPNRKNGEDLDSTFWDSLIGVIKNGKRSNIGGIYSPHGIGRPDGRAKLVYYIHLTTTATSASLLPVHRPWSFRPCPFRAIFSRIVRALRVSYFSTLELFVAFSASYQHVCPALS